MCNYGSSVEAIRKAFTHLTEESFLCRDITVLTPLPMGEGRGRGCLLMSYSFLFKKSSYTILHTFEEVGPTAT